MYENFNDFPKEDNIWDKKKVVKFLNDNKEKMNKLRMIKISENLYLLNIQWNNWRDKDGVSIQNYLS